MSALATFLANALERLFCRHSWRYSCSANRRTATEVCRYCTATRRLRVGPSGSR